MVYCNYKSLFRKALEKVSSDADRSKRCTRDGVSGAVNNLLIDHIWC